MLTMALFLERYLKQSLSDDDRQKIEAKWLCMWKEKLGQPQRSPTQVMKAYCSTLDTRWTGSVGQWMSTATLPLRRGSMRSPND
jgi:hypothetical protein